MRTADTSVVVAALSSWHPQHEQAKDAIATVTVLPTHVVVETVAVLTRLPAGIAIEPRDAVEVVRESFPSAPLMLSSAGLSRLLDAIGAVGIRGGATYDALVAATALEAGATLLSRDQRAQRVYRAIGVDVELVG